LPDALRSYEEKLYKSAQKAAKMSKIYERLFFHERGGIAMVEHFVAEKNAAKAAWEKQQDEFLDITCV
jgi:hypothetical protein